MNKRLEAHNRMVRRWADRQPPKYRKSARAFGYRCDTRTHSFAGTLDWISRKSRERPGEGVSRRTLFRHLAEFTEQGLVTVEKRRNGDKNMSSVYKVNFDVVMRESAAVAADDPWADVPVAEPFSNQPEVSHLTNMPEPEPVDDPSEPDLDGLIERYRRQSEPVVSEETSYGDWRDILHG